MTSASLAAPRPSIGPYIGDKTLVRWALVALGILTMVRIGALFVTPLELYPDEAQYWLWSRTLDFGYYSKPPMIAWLIAATTAIGGNGEAWVRLSGPLLHMITAMALYATGRALGGARNGMRIGLIAGLIYSLMPAVQLSSFALSTDAPLLAALSVSLWLYVRISEARLEQDNDMPTHPTHPALFAGLGLALGMAFLSKYAALYFAGGFVAHSVLVPSARQRWTPVGLMLCLGVFALVISPNLIWNATHGFQTVSHTADNAAWDPSKLGNPLSLLRFWGGQVGVFGPVAMAGLVLAGLSLTKTARSELRPSHGLWLVAGLCLLPLLLVSIQAFLSRAHANWAATAYLGASLWVACLWIRSERVQLWLAALACLHGALALLVLSILFAPSLATPLGLDNSLKRVRGWAALTQTILAEARQQPNLSAIAVDDRFLFNAMAYYGRDQWKDISLPPLKAWVREASPQSQPEHQHPLTPEQGTRVLAVSLVPTFTEEFRRDFNRHSALGQRQVRLDPKRTRDVTVFIGKDFNPRPRDPVTGHPMP
ncbi:MAG: ArnT family glycosyltransferase [Asticcacaulis sp.]